MKNKTNNKLSQGKINLRRKLFGIFVATIILVIATSMLILLPMVTGKQEKSVIYSYKITNNIKYRVYFKENDYLDEKNMGMNQNYIADLVDYIEVDFASLYSASMKTNLLSNYSIEATIVGEYKVPETEENSKIWQKKYNIESVDITNYDDQNQINYNRKAKLTLDEYKDEVKRFQKELRLPMSTKLVVKFNSEVKAEEYNIDKISDMELIIPLDESIFSITTNYDKTISSNIYSEEVDNSILKINIIFIMVSCIFILGAGVYLYKNIKVVIKTLHKNKYTRTLNKIRRDYDELIIDLKEPINLKNYQIVEVKTFEELMDLENEIRIPILNYEPIKGKEAWFVIIQQNLAYRYILLNVTKKL